MFYLIQIIYKMAIGCCKLSFCFFYFRIFPSSNRTFRRVNIALIICIVLYSVASVGSTIFQCRPMARIWDKSVTGHCINFTAFWYTNGAYNVTTDLLIIIIPIAVCCKLQIKKGEMIGLCLIFSVGIL